MNSLGSLPFFGGIMILEMVRNSEIYDVVRRNSYSVFSGALDGSAVGLCAGVILTAGVLYAMDKMRVQTSGIVVVVGAAYTLGIAVGLGAVVGATQRVWREYH